MRALPFAARLAWRESRSPRRIDSASVAIRAGFARDWYISGMMSLPATMFTSANRFTG